MIDRTAPLRVVVDRRDGKQIVLVDDDGREYLVLGEELPKECRTEGAVLDVPRDAKRDPLWLSAHRNQDEENARRNRAGEVLRRLRRRDPGGDVDL